MEFDRRSILAGGVYEKHGFLNSNDQCRLAMMVRVALASLLRLAMFTLLINVAEAQIAKDQSAPHLEKRGMATQLIVDGKPYLALAGELRNSSATSRAYMAPLWSQLAQANINTVLAGVPWNVIERKEGQFDFTMIDELLADARTNHQHLVLLWFGSWKNGLSTYAPEWVKRDSGRFPRVLTRSGTIEVLSPFSDNNARADAAAFAALMHHVKAVDGAEHTGIMLQLENEVGLLGDTRDRSAAAESAHATLVPEALMTSLEQNRDALHDNLRRLWQTSNFKRSGTWTEVFGSSPAADEIFMAWSYSRYFDRVAEAGKREYSLPIFVNAWLVQPKDHVPGDYPGGGPQAHLHDIWRIGAPHLDILAGDIYLPNFNAVAAQYAHPGAAFFVPESQSSTVGAANAVIAIGRYNSIGYSPFGVPNRNGNENAATDPLVLMYGLLREIAPLVLEQQAKGGIDAVSLDPENPKEDVTVGGYRLTARRLETHGEPLPDRGCALILATGRDEFLVAGSNVQITFATNGGNDEDVGLANVEEGVYVNGVWKPGRNLNGDEVVVSYDIATMAAERQSGSGLRFHGAAPTLQKVRLYVYPHSQ
jgi:hypothetical protein